VDLTEPVGVDAHYEFQGSTRPIGVVDLNPARGWVQFAQVTSTLRRGSHLITRRKAEGQLFVQSLSVHAVTVVLAYHLSYCCL
jgi:hypothetical protein